MQNPSPSEAVRRMASMSSIGRPLDPSYPTNIAIMIITLLAGIGFGGWALLRGAGLGDSAYMGLLGGFAAFAGWMFCRELDPDRPYLAFAGAVLALAGFALRGPYGALALFALVTLLRIVTRTVGPAARVGDAVVALVLMALAMFWGFDWQLGLAGALAFALDALLPGGRPRQWVFVGISLLLSLALIVINAGFPAPRVDLGLPWIIGGGFVSLSFATAIMLCREINSRCDLGDRPIQPARIRAAMAVALAYATLLVWNGQSGMDAALPLWAALLAIGIGRWIERPAAAASVE